MKHIMQNDRKVAFLFTTSVKIDDNPVGFYINRQARSQAYSHTPGSTSILKNDNFKWPKNAVKLES